MVSHAATLYLSVALVAPTDTGEPEDSRDALVMYSLPSYASCFHSPVHGTVFGQRTAVVHRLHKGDRLILVPDPPGTDVPAVWVHATGGDVVGHLPLQVAVWLAPWMLGGGRCSAEVEKVHGDDVASWERLLVTVRCRVPEGDARDSGLGIRDSITDE